MATADGKLDYESLMTSKPFKLVVGPDKKEFYMHSSLLSQQSEPLNVLVNGHMKEAAQQEVEWSDVDVGTFVRFCQWAYSGNYTDPHPVVIPDESTDGQTVTIQVDDQSIIEPFPTMAKSKKKGKKITTEPPGPFSLPEPNTSSEDYSGIMLCHAGLYVLGDRYNIALLRQLASYKLHVTLQHFVMHPVRLDAIPKLVNYVWNNTMSKDKLRKLVSTYCACIAEDLMKHFPTEFESLVEDIPEFASGLMANIMPRLA
ncbi:hypothetical protein B0H67DRAFT_537892 [Lasiosphaeris hirsuta]|uniref:BTB domain-containing protein n=1 Tax=Lasiosphaeris hirsuta TaxID=260670 RepID=A0AA40AGL6_9PEZI|nr:hypothetical protein B0H67DRAFT_537892 [Lasiosphaeris hirsuta]